MNTVDVLRQARDLISDPKNWTREAYARFGNHHVADPLDERATCWCAVGALRKVAGASTDQQRLVVAARVRLERALTIPTVITDFNDQQDHEAVLAAFDRAIASGREQ